jgi:membrane-associated phospholipid phosphatase
MPDFDFAVLAPLDEALFRLGNHAAANPLGDAVFPVITANAFMLPAYGAMLVYAYWYETVFGSDKTDGSRRSRNRTLVMLAMLLLAIVLTDQSIIVIKDVIARERPCHALSGVRLLVECGTGRSMPSAHAANNMAAALVVGSVYRRLRWYLLGWAVLVGYSRVYCGVHYPFDVAAGAAWGAVLAGLVLAARVLIKRMLAHSLSKNVSKTS